MPFEAWVALAVTGVGALLVGVLIGRRTRTPAPHAQTVSRPTADYSDRLLPTDALGIGLLVLDTDGLIVANNSFAEQLLGTREGGLLGRSTMEAFIDHTVADVVAEARAAGQAGGEYALSGEPQRTLEVHAWSASDGALWIALEDVSELQRLRRIRTEFVDNLSHELRTPLSTVRLLTESLSLEAERTELPARMHETIGKIDVETGHLVQMVNELLDLARIEQGEAPLRRDEVDMAAVVANTLGRLRIYAERQAITLRDDVAAEPAERVVLGDEDRLDQVLVNLVQNAIKFSPPESEVVVHVRAETEAVVVEVEDHGVGIAHAELDRIFERFYKADRARSRGRGGTGLGLSIARHILERHGGRIWVESEEGVGSRFFVSLPRHSTQAPAAG